MRTERTRTEDAIEGRARRERRMKEEERKGDVSEGVRKKRG